MCLKVEFKLSLAVAEYERAFSYIIFLFKFYSQAVLQVATFVNLILSRANDNEWYSYRSCAED